MVLAFLIPGAGHFYLGRRGRALAFFAIVLSMFVAGILLQGKVYVSEPGKPLTALASLASLGLGIPYFVARAVGVAGNITSITYEYGTAFTLTAGLMNLLLVLDSYDIAEERKR
jgi:TM2 domain-containing membrane protein YozV